MQAVLAALRAPALGRTPLLVTDAAAVPAAVAALSAPGPALVVPVFLVSAVSGQNLDLLRLCLGRLPADPAGYIARAAAPVDFQVAAGVPLLVFPVPFPFFFFLLLHLARAVSVVCV